MSLQAVAVKIYSLGLLLGNNKPLTFMKVRSTVQHEALSLPNEYGM